VAEIQAIQAHFHPDERPFVERVMDWIDQVEAKHIVKLTDFLDPRQRYIVQTLVRRQAQVECREAGGYDDAERARVILAQDYVPIEHEDAGLVLIRIQAADEKFASLQHGDFLGALLGLGIVRGKLGDIHYHPDKGVCYVIVASEIADFIRLQLNQVHRVHVRTEIIDLSEFESIPVGYEEMMLSVASLRLDGIVSDVVRMSRAKVLAPIKSGRCKVNWRVTEDPSAQVQQGDVVSLQGFGRFKILEVIGNSKSGRIRLRVGKVI
jgi:RNA-binding protein YlmH